MKEDNPDRYQLQVQKSGPVMGWGCKSALGKDNLHFCHGSINAEKYTGILAHHISSRCQLLVTFMQF